MRRIFLLILLTSSFVFSQNRLAPFKELLPKDIFQYPVIVDYELNALKEEINLDPDLVYYRIMTRVAIHDRTISKDSVKSLHNYVKNQAYSDRSIWAINNLENFKDTYPDYPYIDYVEGLYKGLANFEKLPGAKEPEGPGKDSLNLFAARYIDYSHVSITEAKKVLSEYYKKKRSELEDLYNSIDDINVIKINLYKLIENNWLVFEKTSGISPNELIHKYYDNLYASSYYGELFVSAGPNYYIGGVPIDVKYTFDELNSEVTIFNTELTQTLSFSAGYNFFLSKYRDPFAFITAELGVGYVILPEISAPQLLFSTIEKKNEQNINTMLFLREAEVNSSQIITTNLRVSTPFYYLTRNLLIELGANIHLNTLFYSFTSVRDYESINLQTLEIEPHGMTEGEFTLSKSQTWLDPQLYLALSYYVHKNLNVTLGFNGSFLSLRSAIFL